MRERKNMNITEETLKKHQDHLQDEEKSLVTIEKYTWDVRRFMEHLEGDGEFSREKVWDYKQELEKAYKITNTNPVLAAVNSFLVFAGYGEWRVRLFKTQKVQYSWSEWKITGKEYERLVHTACRQEDEQMSMPLQTIGSTGIRISELKSIMVEALSDGQVEIYNKGKCRVVLLPEELTRLLKKYCKKAEIVVGSIFISRQGNPVDRSNMGKKMEQLGREVGVDTEKIFPYSLRHLFARTFCSIEKDVVRLMDLLGHSSINTTRIYTTTTEEQPRRQMSRMRLVFGQNGFTAKK